MIIPDDEIEHDPTHDFCDCMGCIHKMLDAEPDEELTGPPPQRVSFINSYVYAWGER